MLLRLPNLLMRLISSPAPQFLVSHQSGCELSHLEAMVCIIDNWMCAVSLFNKEHGFVVRCNVGIMCEVWASAFFSCYDTLLLQEGLIHTRVYWCIMKQVCFKPLSYNLHPIGTQFFSFYFLCDLFIFLFSSYWS